MSDVREVRNRLIVVEDQVARLIDDSAATRAMAAMADRDVAEHRQEMRGHTRVLNALRQTQIEHGETLSEHGRLLSQQAKTLDQHTRTLDRHMKTLDDHTKTLDRHSKMLDGHTRTLDQHTKTLDRHTKTLDDHTATLDQHGASLGLLLAGQAAIMRHFGIEAGENDRIQE